MQSMIHFLEYNVLCLLYLTDTKEIISSVSETTTLDIYI